MSSLLLPGNLHGLTRDRKIFSQNMPCLYRRSKEEDHVVEGEGMFGLLLGLFSGCFQDGDEANLREAQPSRFEMPCMRGFPFDFNDLRSKYGRYGGDLSSKVSDAPMHIDGMNVNAMSIPTLTKSSKATGEDAELRQSSIPSTPIDAALQHRPIEHDHGHLSFSEAENASSNRVSNKYIEISPDLKDKLDAQEVREEETNNMEEGDVIAMEQSTANDVQGAKRMVDREVSCDLLTEPREIKEPILGDCEANGHGQRGSDNKGRMGPGFHVNNDAKDGIQHHGTHRPQPKRSSSKDIANQEIKGHTDPFMPEKDDMKDFQIGMPALPQFSTLGSRDDITLPVYVSAAPLFNLRTTKGGRPYRPRSLIDYYFLGADDYNGI